MKRYIAWLILFAITEISLAMYLTFWREHWWQAISQKQSVDFLQQLGIFTGVALFICIVSGVSGYLIQLTAVKWREKLNTKALYILESRTSQEIENMSQRVQSDCAEYPTLMLTIGFGGIKAITYIIVFCTAILLGFNFMYLLIILAWSVVGTLLAKYIAKPLIKLNYDQQRAEATYRQGLTLDNFQDCIRIMLGLAKKQKHLTYFQQLFGQIGVIIPFLIIAPEYFGGAMLIGQLMRFNSTASTILENMSFTITSFADINRLLSCRARLKEASII